VKDVVKSRVIGQLEERETVIANDVTRFCNQVSALIKGVSDSKQI